MDRILSIILQRVSRNDYKTVSEGVETVLTTRRLMSYIRGTIWLADAIPRMNTLDSSGISMVERELEWTEFTITRKKRGNRW